MNGLGEPETVGETSAARPAARGGARPGSGDSTGRLPRAPSAASATDPVGRVLDPGTSDGSPERGRSEQHRNVTGAAVVEVTGVSVRYRNGALGVTGTSLRAGAGEMVALFGPNGAGKTSTVRALSGFLRSEGAHVSGTVLVGGVSVANREPHRVTPLGVAFVPERRKLFPSMTVADNLAALGRTLSRSRRKQLREQTFALFPVLSDRGGELAGRLSGGQQQMVAIGRALMTDPRVLIVDELTLGLHHSLHEPLYRAVRRIADEGTAVIVVDESTGFALEFADHCYLFGGGTVKDQGSASRFRGSELLAAGYVEAD